MRLPRVLVCTSAAVVAIVAAGCASTPLAPGRETVGAAVSERAGVDARGLPVPGREWAAPPGVTLDDGLGLDESVAVALWNNAEFHAALSTLGIARADLIEAGLLRNPIFSLLFPWGPKQLEFTATFAADQLWQRPKRIQDARLNAEAAAEQLVANGLRLVADVRLAFFDVLVAGRRLTLAAEQAEVAAQAAKLAEGRLRAGDISEFEARLARTDALRLEAGRLTRVTGRDLAIARLRTLLGLDSQAREIRLTEPAAAAADSCPSGSELFQIALAARPEVRAAELQIEAAGARAGLERARIIAITALLDANAEGAEGFEMGPGAGIEIPLLSQNQGRRARAAADVEQASRRYLAVRATVSSEVAAAVIGLTEARNTARLLNDDVAASLATARLQAERLYTAGEISLLTLLETRQRLIDVEVTRVDAMFGVDRAIVRLEQAIGRTCGAR
jgi:cobalt-zinc-cadmium efflux system outer membrane protein